MNKPKKPGALWKYIGDLLALLGAILILIGVYIVCPVATWFAGGMVLILMGIVVEVGQQRSAKQ